MSSTDHSHIFGNSSSDAAHGNQKFPGIHVRWHATVQTPEAPVNVNIVEVYGAGFWFVGDVAYMTGRALALQINMPDPINRSEHHFVSCQTSVLSSVLTREGFRTDVAIKSIMPVYQEMLNNWLKVRAEG